MNDLGGEVRRLCVAVAIEAETGGRRAGARHREMRRRLAEVIEEAAGEAGLDRLYVVESGGPAPSHVESEVSGPVRPGTGTGAGPGLLLILPPGVNEARVIAGLVGELRVALRRRNQRPGKDAPSRLRLRLRAAFHQGPTRIVDGGFAGRAVTTVCAMRDGDELRAALRERPGADLAVAISAPLFEEVVEHAHRDLVRDMFHPVTPRSADVATRVWISAPDAVQKSCVARRAKMPLTAG
ncbi:hypothetical protein [Sphaerisporangium dianthi]|uniref:Uncharacterized protein n=1 Tax=Sphaerisporangium dianthi TaxID=1436120 RepID=A0ABV9CHK4_9ACTN